MRFAIRTIHNGPSNRRVGRPTKTLPQLFARVLNRQSLLFGFIKAPEKETMLQAVQAWGWTALRRYHRAHPQS